MGSKSVGLAIAKSFATFVGQARQRDPGKEIHRVAIYGGRREDTLSDIFAAVLRKTVGVGVTVTTRVAVNGVTDGAGRQSNHPYDIVLKKGPKVFAVVEAKTASTNIGGVSHKISRLPEDCEHLRRALAHGIRGAYEFVTLLECYDDGKRLRKCKWPTPLSYKRDHWRGRVDDSMRSEGMKPFIAWNRCEVPGLASEPRALADFALFQLPRLDE